MIKANELRVGNYILFKEWGKGGGKVGKIKPGDFGRVVGDDPEDSEYHPIPLDPEWLKRCGLIQEHPSGVYPIGNQFYLKQNLLKDETGSVRGYILMSMGYHGLVTKPHIVYLHQLQNLYFALTGEELNVKI